MTQDIQHIIKAAQAGGEVLRTYFGQSLVTAQKCTARDFKTKADTESEEAIIKLLETAFPTYSIFSEERGFMDKKSEYTFYIDPLDGTYNFVLGIPQFSVSIGLYKNKQAMMGVVHHPILNNTYSAMRGQGALLNGASIKVSNEVAFPKATVAYNCAWNTSEKYQHMLGIELGKRDFGRLTLMWSPALDLSLLAQGKIEAMMVHGSELYDFAAGKLIAREAGAKITDFAGAPERNDTNNEFIISNGPAIHDEVVRALKEIERQET